MIYFIELKFGVWYRNLFRRKYILLDKGIKTLNKGTYFKKFNIIAAREFVHEVAVVPSL